MLNKATNKLNSATQAYTTLMNVYPPDRAAINDALLVVQNCTAEVAVHRSAGHYN